jgi:hypothetical protein
MSSPLPLSTRERKQLFKIAAATPRAVESMLFGLSSQQLLCRPKTGLSLHELSLHEQVWHLADLEVFGFKKRFNAILSEERPLLEDFDGDAVAAERNYHSLSLQQAFHLFSETRLQNLWLLSGINPADWMRRGEQQGLGVVNLADVFRSMAAHDRAHLSEIETILHGDSAAGHSTIVAA